MATDQVGNHQDWLQSSKMRLGWEKLHLRISESWLVLVGRVTLEQFWGMGYDKGYEVGFDHGLRKTRAELATHMAKVEEATAKAANTNQTIISPDTLISTAIISTRVRRFCEEHSIKKLSELAEIDDWEFYRFPNFGETSRQEVDKILKSIGLKRKRWSR